MHHKSRQSKMRMAGQREAKPLLTGPAGIWPFPVAKVVLIVVLIRQLPKIAEAQAQQDAAAN